MRNFERRGEGGTLYTLNFPTISTRTEDNLCNLTCMEVVILGMVVAEEVTMVEAWAGLITVGRGEATVVGINIFSLSVRLTPAVTESVTRLL